MTWVLLLPFAAALIGYLCASAAETRRGRPWPWWRTSLWAAGIVIAAGGFVGPLVGAAHGDFVGHVVTHVAVGMVAPALLVLGAPMTLALRTLTQVPAKRLSRLLRSAPARALTNPVVAAILNVGGMWVLYLTPLHRAADIPIVHLMLTLHFLLVGYLFTASLLCVDPSPHRSSLRVRVVVLLLTIAAHGVLAKLIYADPPPGFSIEDVHAGAQLMFYAGDVVDLALLALLGWEWYRTTGRSLSRRTLSVHREVDDEPQPQAR